LKAFSLLSESDFKRDWLSTFETVFRLPENHVAQFNCPDWESFYLPGGMLMDSDELDSLSRACRNVGDDFIVGTTHETIPPFQYSLEMPISRAGIEAGRIDGYLGIFDSALFGKSGSWGLICFHDGYGCLSGSGEFFNHYFENSNDRNKLRRKFAEYAKLELEDELCKLLLNLQAAT